MRIAISSMSGCGNTSVCTALSERLNYTLVNYTFRQLAAEKGHEFWKFCKMAETDDSIDIELDNKQVEKALNEENCILGSRLAIWMLKEADLKVYLKASALTRAHRIFKRESGNLDEKIKETEQRDLSDTTRYKRIYNIDNTKPHIADLVIDTDDKTVEEIVDIIIAKMNTL